MTNSQNSKNWILLFVDWSEAMRVCQICKKGSMIQKSGAHQYGGGWAMRAPKTRAVWKPNLHSVKVTYQGTRQTMRLCSKCLRRVKADMNPKTKEEVGTSAAPAEVANA